MVSIIGLPARRHQLAQGRSRRQGPSARMLARPYHPTGTASRPVRGRRHDHPDADSVALCARHAERRSYYQQLLALPYTMGVASPGELSQAPSPG